MTKQERNHNYYVKAKEENRCWVCGKPKDRDGYYCSICLEKKNADERESKKLMISLGICPSCKKNTIMGDERQCPECRAKEADRMARKRAENREEYQAYHNQYRNKLYEERKKNGLCPRCGKTPDDSRYKMCSSCRNKKTTNRRKKQGIKRRSDRTINGICYFCDNPVKKGYKVCEKHYQMNLEKSHSKKANEAREKLKKEGIIY